MTKPTKKKSANDWTFDMQAGRATHVPTGLEFWMYPNWHALLDAPPSRSQARLWETVDLRELGLWRYMGHAQLPADVPERRPPGFPRPGDANSRELDEWPVLAAERPLQAALDALAARHGPAVARQMIEALGRDAGQRWAFRARLERGWADGARAM